jgi:ABC-2 type transport system ATP-binding protein
MYTLTFDHLTKRYGREVVVDDLSFAVQPGRVTGFLGPNGAGKSTVMRMLLDLAKPTAGDARINGRRYRDLPDPLRTVGVVLEPNAFHPGRSGRNHLRVLADGIGAPVTRVDELLEAVGLTHAADRHVRGYSLGMRQRLSIAAALIGDPTVLVLDEPGNGLDPQGIRWLRDLLRARAAIGHTVFVSSHLLAEIEHLADDVVVINRGKLIVNGELAALQHAGVTVRTPQVAALTELLTAAGATVTGIDDGALLVRRLSSAEIGDRACSAGIPLHELAAEAGSLESLFLTWTSDAKTVDLAGHKEAMLV